MAPQRRNRRETDDIASEALARLVLRLLEPTEGEVLFEGEDILGFEPHPGERGHLEDVGS